MTLWTAESRFGVYPYRREDFHMHFLRRTKAEDHAIRDACSSDSHQRRKLRVAALASLLMTSYGQILIEPVENEDIVTLSLSISTTIQQGNSPLQCGLNVEALLFKRVTTHQAACGGAAQRFAVARSTGVLTWSRTRTPSSDQHRLRLLL
jgi:hypothetical protein